MIAERKSQQQQQHAPCPLRLDFVTPASTAAQPYSDPLVWKFDVSCSSEMETPFEVVFSYMCLGAGKKDIPLEDFEIDSLPEGKSAFELEHEMPPIDKIDVLDLIGGHGISIVLRVSGTGEHIAFRGAEVVVEWADKKFEEDLPDEILPEMLRVRCVGVRGQKVRPREE